MPAWAKGLTAWFREQGIELKKEPQKETAIPRNQRAAQHFPPKVTLPA
jgi:hypothetical protein